MNQVAENLVLHEDIVPLALGVLGKPLDEAMNYVSRNDIGNERDCQQKGYRNNLVEPGGKKRRESVLNKHVVNSVNNAKQCRCFFGNFVLYHKLNFFVSAKLSF
jgi:HD superfamily phosphodiesterase